MTAWVVRVGEAGERDAWALGNGLAGGGFHEVGSLADLPDRAAIQSAVAGAFQGDPPGRIANFTGQLNALRHVIKPGDVIVTPLKTTKKIALGVCTSGYTFRADESDPDKRHVIGVDWKRTDVSRAAIKDDLLNTLNGAMTIFRAERNDAEKRLRAVLDTGVDPGASGAGGPVKTVLPDDVADVTDPSAVPTLQAVRDRVQTHLIENFKGHGLTALIADILRAKGFTCDVSPAGPDQGVDILVGSGPLGLDEPKLVVEVKSQDSAVDSEVVRRLQGAIATYGASQGLLVAWAGLNKPARDEIRQHRLKVRVWEADQVLDELFAVYELLPADTRRLVPLTRAWVLAEDDADG